MKLKVPPIKSQQRPDKDDDNDFILESVYTPSPVLDKVENMALFELFATKLSSPTLTTAAGGLVWRTNVQHTQGRTTRITGLTSCILFSSF